MPGFIDLFEQASGIDVPDTIAGVTIPNVDLGNVGEVAQNFVEAAQSLDDMVDKATQAREIVAQGSRTAGNCFGVIDQAFDAVESIKSKIEPLSPLLNFSVDRAPEAMSMFGKDNLMACIDIIDDVVGLGKLLQKISGLLKGVQAVFSSIMEVCGDIIEKCMEFVGDLASAFAEAICLDNVLAGIQDLFDNISNTVTELMSVGEVLMPINKAWEEANWVELATFGFQNFEGVKDAFQRFWPAWEASEAAYGEARGMGESCNNQARTAWQKYRRMFKKICNTFGVEVPDGVSGRDLEAQPTVAPRGGFLPPLEDEDSDAES